MGYIADMVSELEGNYSDLETQASEDIEKLEKRISELESEVSDLENESESGDEPDVRDYLTNTLSKLLCDRYNVSYHTTKQKLVDLVEKELSI